MILGAIVVALLLIKLVLPLFAVAVYVLLGLIPVLLMLAGLFSCLTSSKPTNLKLLWVLVIILAPFLGPLLWFFWGRQNT